MPDPNQYDPNQYQMPSPSFAPMPDPTQMMGNYQFMQNQQIMYQQQSQMQQAFNTAQFNFHRHMDSVLQGTMAAGMAAYQGANTVINKANERQYNDVLLGNGNYALQRSMSRDIAFDLGIAQSDLGRALKIGGRRPEFLGYPEYEYQMKRSAAYGREELVDMLIGGGSAMGSTLGMATGGMGFLAGIGLDATLGTAVKPWLSRRKARREMSMFTDMQDFSNQVGQTRMSRGGSDELAMSFYQEDVSAAKYIPFIGEALNKRLRPETLQEETFKKMAQGGLLRDVNTNDIDAVKKTVKETAAFIEKFAGLANTTKDAILQLKSSFSSLNMNAGQQNAAIQDITRTVLSTGLDFNTISNVGASYVDAGKQTGFYRLGSPGSQIQYGLQDFAAIRAGQEAGRIDRGYDPGTLSMQRYMNAAQMAETPWGKVVEHGGGNVMRTAAYYAKKGGGSVIHGMTLEGTDEFGKTANPFEVLRENQEQLIKRFGFEKAEDIMSGWQNDRAWKNQVRELFSGTGEMNRRDAEIKVGENYLNKIGLGPQTTGINRGFSLRSLDALTNADPGFLGTILSDAPNSKRRALTEAAILSGRLDVITQQSPKDDMFHGYDRLKKNSSTMGLFNTYFSQLTSGNFSAERTTAAKEAFLQAAQNGYVNTREQGEIMLGSLLHDTDKFNKSKMRYLEDPRFNPLAMLMPFKSGSREYESLTHTSVGELAINSGTSGSMIDYLASPVKGFGIIRSVDKMFSIFGEGQTSKGDIYNRLMNDKNYNSILSEISNATTDSQKSNIFKKYGYDNFASYQVEEVLREIGIKKSGGMASLKESQGLRSVYESMRSSDVNKKLLDSAKITNLSEYASSQINLRSALLKLTPEQLSNDAYRSSIIGGLALKIGGEHATLEASNIVQDLMTKSGKDFSDRINTLANAKAGEKIDIPGMPQAGKASGEVNNEAINKMAEAFTAIAAALNKT